MKIFILILCVFLSFNTNANSFIYDKEDRTARNINYYGNLNSILTKMLSDNESHHMDKAEYHLSQYNQLRSPNELDYAEAELDYMLKRWANHPRALNSLVIWAKNTKNFNKAIKYFQNAIEVDPSIAVTHSLFGILLFHTKDYNKALDHFLKANKLQTDSAEFQYNLGLTYYELGDYKNARIAAQKAYTLGHPLPALRDKLKSKKEQ